MTNIEFIAEKLRRRDASLSDRDVELLCQAAVDGERLEKRIKAEDDWVIRLEAMGVSRRIFRTLDGLDALERSDSLGDGGRFRAVIERQCRCERDVDVRLPAESFSKFEVRKLRTYRFEGYRGRPERRIALYVETEIR